MFLFVKQKTAYEMRISDWSSDVCSSDLPAQPALDRGQKIGLDDRKRLPLDAEIPRFAPHRSCQKSGGGESGSAKHDRSGPLHRMGTPVPRTWRTHTKPMSA